MKDSAKVNTTPEPGLHRDPRESLLKTSPAADERLVLRYAVRMRKTAEDRRARLSAARDTAGRGGRRDSHPIQGGEA